jgi:hypothetical protein
MPQVRVIWWQRANSRIGSGDVSDGQTFGATLLLHFPGNHNLVTSDIGAKMYSFALLPRGCSLAVSLLLPRAGKILTARERLSPLDLA